MASFKLSFAAVKKLLIMVFFLLLPINIAVAATPVVEFDVSSFAIEGDNQLNAEETNTTLAPFLGHHQGLEQLLAAAKALETAHADKGYAFHRVILPAQTMDNDVITLTVVAFTLGNTEITGNEYFTQEQILASLPLLQAGQALNTRELTRNLSLANRHPSREHVINIKKGEEADTVDADIKVKDKRPYMGFVGINNIGTKDSGRVRITGGGQDANFLGFDDILTASYTTSQKYPEDVKQYGVSYSVPIYQWASQINTFYSYSDVDSGTVNSFDISGAGQFMGFNINHILLSHGNYSHEINVGLIDKLFKNDSIFAGINFSSDVRSRPINLAYTGIYKTEKVHASATASFNINTGAGGKNSDLEYAINRLGADTDWQRWNLDAFINYFLENDWLVRGIAEVQLTDDALIPGEQFGLGGMYSVRGFEERAVSSDSGLRLTAEVWSPPLEIIKDLRVLAFIDYGYMDRETTFAGEDSSDSIMSIGLGTRWNWQENINLAVDYGYVINDAEHLRDTEADHGNVKFHVNLLVRF
jgi:hemolysin activation/secretion protein